MLFADFRNTADKQKSEKPRTLGKGPNEIALPLDQEGRGLEVVWFNNKASLISDRCVRKAFAGKYRIPIKRDRLLHNPGPTHCRTIHREWDAIHFVVADRTLRRKTLRPVQPDPAATAYSWWIRLQLEQMVPTLPQQRQTSQNTHSGEKVFRKILNTASAHNIPSGRIPKAKPNIPPAASRLIKQRDETRRNNPHSEDIPTLNARIDFLISKQRMEKWKEHVATFDRKTNVTKLWKTIGAITGKKQSAPPNQGIKFNEKQIKDASSMSNAFNIQYARPMNHKTEKDNRKINRNIKKQPLNDAPVITSKQVKTAIQNAKNSKAFGPDNISTTHMKHLGPNAINYLTKIFNLSLSKCQIPAIWKSSVIIPLLKPGKDAGLSNSYRPVSLLCPASKILEKCIQPLITEHLHFASHQHGFRSKHSTVTALCDITTAISNGFNRKKPADSACRD